MNPTDEEIAKLAEEAGYTLEQAYAALGKTPPGAEAAAGAAAPVAPVSKVPRAKTTLAGGAGSDFAALLSAADRMTGGNDSDAAAQGAEGRAARATRPGAVGSMLGNAAIGAVLPWMRGVSKAGMLGAAALGGGLEAAQEYGEGGDPLGGAARGAGATTAGNLVMSGLGKGANALLKAGNMPGRWSDPTAEEIYDFAKRKGVDLRAGDLPGHGLARVIENTNLHGIGTGGLNDQADQLRAALWENHGDEIAAGLRRASDKAENYVSQLWQDAEAKAVNATKIKPNNVWTEVKALETQYPHLLESVKHEPTRAVIDKIASATGRGVVPKLTYQEMRDLQSNVGGMAAGDVYSGTTVSAKEAGAMKQLVKAAHNDLAQWGAIPGNEDAYAAYLLANDTHKDQLLPFRNNPLVKKVLGQDVQHPYAKEQMAADITAARRDANIEDLLGYLHPDLQRAKVKLNPGERVPIAQPPQLRGLDPDTANFIRMARMADRGTRAVTRAPSEGTFSDTSLAGAVTRLLTGDLPKTLTGVSAGSPKITRLAGASPRVLPKVAAGALAAMLGLSADNLSGLRTKEKDE